MDANETFGDITIGNVPSGAQLSAGIDNGDGTWTLTNAELVGLTLTPAANSSDDLTLTTAVTFTDGDATRTFNGTISVVVNAVADDVELDQGLTQLYEDTLIPLELEASLADTDGSETLVSMTVAGVPEGALLSAGDFDSDTGLWTVLAADIDSLAITPAEHDATDIVLTLTLNSEEVIPITVSLSPTPPSSKKWCTSIRSPMRRMWWCWIPVALVASPLPWISLQRSWISMAQKPSVKW